VVPAPALLPAGVRCGYQCHHGTCRLRAGCCRVAACCRIGSPHQLSSNHVRQQQQQQQHRRRCAGVAAAAHGRCRCCGAQGATVAVVATGRHNGSRDESSVALGGQHNTPASTLLNMHACLHVCMQSSVVTSVKTAARAGGCVIEPLQTTAQSPHSSPSPLPAVVATLQCLKRRHPHLLLAVAATTTTTTSTANKA
jgi:hypothetical protein